MIKNLSNNKTIAKNAEFCRSLFSRFVGLMFSPKNNKAFVFEFDKEQFISLHMIFVFYPIDVLFLDGNKMVVDIKERFKPFTFYTSKKKAMYAIELPKGTIKKSGTKIWDRINS